MIPIEEPRSTVMRDRAERGIWQRRYWEHTIRDDADYAAHIDYIHFNPVRHGLTRSAADWPTSSFHDCVKRGYDPPDWIGTDGTMDAGEPRERP